MENEADVVTEPTAVVMPEPVATPATPAEKPVTPKRLAARLLTMALRRNYLRVFNCSTEDLSEVLDLPRIMSDGKKEAILVQLRNTMTPMVARLNKITGQNDDIFVPEEE